MKDWWYITYYCVNHTSHYGVTATKLSPAVWSVHASRKHEDGPYIILYAEKCSKDEADYINGYMS